MTKSVRKADNLLIKHYPGFLLQENHYYPFGLLNIALSSDEQKGFHQRYGFNGKEFENGLDWRVNDFGARMYDPVLGRWGSVDPKAHLAPSWSPYNAMWCNPILNIDPDGQYAVSVHYNITYNTLIKLGYSNTVADNIAHHASVYADHPELSVLNLVHSSF